METEWIKDKKHISEFNFDSNLIPISDQFYINFMMNFGDGFYFNNSLHIYGISKNMTYHDFDFRNKQLKSLYNWVENIENMYFFGEDLFCNQFVIYSLGIGMFLIESGQIEFIAKNFKEWVKVLNEDLDFYTGESLIKSWNSLNKRLGYSERLTPKKPFVLGGDYDLKNLHCLNFESILSFNSDIARQIHNLPDGSKIQIKIM